MKDYGKVYLKAADLMERGVVNYSCIAISYAVIGSLVYKPENSAVLLYAKIFSPNGKPGYNRSPFARTVERDPDPKALRLTMLAMAAACWRDMLPLLEGK